MSKLQFESLRNTDGIPVLLSVNLGEDESWRHPNNKEAQLRFKQQVADGEVILMNLDDYLAFEASLIADGNVPYYNLEETTAFLNKLNATTPVSGNIK